MDYKKKIKLRLYFSIGFMVLGIFIIIVANVTKTDNQALYTLGSTLFVCGIARIVIYNRNIKDEKTMRALEIRETDERNALIALKAKSMAFSLTIIIEGLSVIVLQLMNMVKSALYLSYFVCFSLVLYIVCYLIIRKKY